MEPRNAPNGFEIFVAAGLVGAAIVAPTAFGSTTDQEVWVGNGSVASSSPPPSETLGMTLSDYVLADLQEPLTSGGSTPQSSTTTQPPSTPSGDPLGNQVVFGNDATPRAGAADADRVGGFTANSGDAVGSLSPSTGGAGTSTGTVPPATTETQSAPMFVPPTTTASSTPPAPTPTMLPPVLTTEQMQQPGEPLPPPGGPTGTQTQTMSASDVVFSQLYSGGAEGGPFASDFLVVLNRGPTTVNVNGWSVQYADAGSNNWWVTPLSGSIAPGQRLLVQMAGNGPGAALPTPDVVGYAEMNAVAGKVALVRHPMPLYGSPIGDPMVADFVGYGNAETFEGSSPAPSPGAGVSLHRLADGTQDTNQNGVDFALGMPTPGNTSLPDNQPPQLNVPSLQRAVAGQPLIFSSQTGNQISVGEPDAAGASVNLQLQVNSGTLTLSGVTNLTGTGNGTGTLNFNGTLSDLNAALDGLQFTPSASFVGSTRLLLSVNDLGNTGNGGPLTTSAGVDIAVISSVSLATVTPTVSESSGESAGFQVTRSGAISEALEVFYEVTGSAEDGIDFVSLTGSVLLSVGATSAPIDITPINDLLAEGDENIVVTLLSDQTYALTGNTSGAVVIADDTLDFTPVVTLRAIDSQSDESPQDILRFRVTRSGPTTAPLTVFYRVSSDGGAVEGIDFQTLPGSIIIPTGESSADFDVTPNADDLDEGAETVVIELAQPPIGADNYEIDTLGAKDMCEIDDEKKANPKAKFKESGITLLEENKEIEVKVVLDAPATMDTKVAFQIVLGAFEGNRHATNGVDFRVLTRPAAVVIKKGAMDGTIRIQLRDDRSPELTEVFKIELTDADGADVPPRDDASRYFKVEIVDNDSGLYLTRQAAGTNHLAAHKLEVTGKGIKVGVLEASNRGGPDDQANVGVDPDKSYLGARDVLGKPRVKKDLDFSTSDESPRNAEPPTADGPHYSEHATLVANIIAGNHRYHTGVAPDAELYVAGISLLGGVQASMDYFQRVEKVGIFNFSGNYEPQGNNNGNTKAALFHDWFVSSRDALTVISAGNFGEDGAPIGPSASAYNVLTVGAVGSDLFTAGFYSSFRLAGESADKEEVRGKPDVLAPGGDSQVGITNGLTTTMGVTGYGTSFAAPHVTGIAALIAEKAGAKLELGKGGGKANHLAYKAIIMNSARKRFAPGAAEAVAVSADTPRSRADASDSDYLDGNELREANSDEMGAAKTETWTPSSWEMQIKPNQVQFHTYSPLDDEQGAGIADANRALTQSEQQKPPGQVGKIGWNIGSLGRKNIENPTLETVQEYKITDQLAAGTFVTATLVWDRPITEIDKGNVPGDNQVEHTDKYEEGEFREIILHIVADDGSFHAQSWAKRSNRGDGTVQHLHVPVPKEGKYTIRAELVKAPIGVSVPYSLAWWAT